MENFEKETSGWKQSTLSFGGLVPRKRKASNEVEKDDQTTIANLSAIQSTTSSKKKREKALNGKEKAKTAEKWRPDEHQRFMEAVRKHGKNWKKVEEHVATRDRRLCASHSQQFRAKCKADPKTEGADLLAILEGPVIQEK